MGTWMNHKRKRPKNRRAGCLMCKPHKMNGFNDEAIGCNSKYGGARGARNKIYADSDLKVSLWTK